MHKVVYTHNINEISNDVISAFYSKLSFYSLEQNTKWLTKYKNENTLFCLLFNNKHELESLSAINIKCHLKFIKMAEINFGPLFINNEAAVNAIESIINYLKNNYYFYLTIQLAIPVGNSSELIEYALNKRFKKIKYKFDSNNWSSIQVDLNLETSSIQSSYSKGHKSSIKKAIKDGVHIIPYKKEYINEIVVVYIKMLKSRNIFTKSEAYWKEKIYSLCNYIEDPKNGFLLLAKLNEKIIGFCLFVSQGNSIRYYMGASDPEFKNISVLHAILNEAIAFSKTTSYRYFDLWGYNHYATEEDQVFFINRFKKGFGGEFTFYPKKMYISLNPLGRIAYNLKQLLR